MQGVSRLRTPYGVLYEVSVRCFEETDDRLGELQTVKCK